MPRVLRTELVTFRDEPTGELGFRLADCPASDEMYAAREGELIAHDWLEHINGAEVIGDIGDELEAMGAIWWARGQHSDIRRGPYGSMHTPHENIAADVSEMLLKVLAHHAAEMPTAPPTRANSYAADWQEIEREAFSSARAEWPHIEDRRSFPASEAREFLKVARARFFIGLRKARRRWPRSYDMNTAFWAIAETVSRAAKSIEYEGQRFRLEYRKGQERAYCEELFEEDY